MEDDDDDDGDQDRKPSAKRRSSHQGGSGGWWTKRRAILGGGAGRDVGGAASSSENKYDTFASVYFNDLRFFEERQRELFIISITHWKKNKKYPHVVDFRVTKVQDLYMKALETCSTELQRKMFFRDNNFVCDSQAVLEDFNEWKRVMGLGNPDDTIKSLRRLVKVDFEIQGAPLSHTYDLECFSKRIDHVLACHENHEDRVLYAGPYFCFVQSSGMGKTKLMYEYTQCSWEKNGVASFWIIPPELTEAYNDEIFDIHHLASVGPSLPAHVTEPFGVREYSRVVASNIFDSLDSMLESLLTNGKKIMKNATKIALLFDESQVLLKKEFGYVAFRLRCVRHWLMEKPGRQKSFRNNLTVVAVFAGTNLQLTDYHFENDGMLVEAPRYSRGYQTKRREYFGTGMQVHSLFCETATMGSCLNLMPKNAGLSEYEQAVYYGRPLFAHMATKGRLEKNLPFILLRMLNHVKWNEENRIGWINLLSTRVQLGQLPAELAYYLVENSFANLLSYNCESRAVRLGYLSDPVTAHLAMMMMDDSQSLGTFLGSTPFKGRDKRWWTEKLMEIISTGMVRPDKGNFGEVVVALYMLFCGDLLRKLINEKNMNKRGTKKQPYSQFSVALDSWLQLLLSGGKLPDATTANCKVAVGFIQVCRNHLRSYDVSWKCLQDQSFLKYIYESGIAFYTFNGCPLIDMVVPLRITTNERGHINGFCYAPMLVSIQCQKEFSQRKAETECWEIQQKATASGLTRALCLLVVFGSEEDAIPFYGDIAIMESTTTKVSDLLMAEVVAKAIRVPTNDEFGLAAAFDSMVSSTQLEAETFAGHNFLKAHGPSTSELIAEKALRKKSLPESKVKYTGLRSAITRSSTRNNNGKQRPFKS